MASLLAAGKAASKTLRPTNNGERRSDFVAPFRQLGTPTRITSLDKTSERLGGIRLHSALNDRQQNYQSPILSQITSTSASVGQKSTDFNLPSSYNSTVHDTQRDSDRNALLRPGKNQAFNPGDFRGNFIHSGNMVGNHYSQQPFRVDSGSTHSATQTTSGNAPTPSLTSPGTQPISGPNSNNSSEHTGKASAGKSLLGGAKGQAALGGFLLANSAVKGGMNILQQKQQQQYQTGLINRATDYMKSNGIPWLPGNNGISTTQASAKNGMTAHGTTNPQGFPSGQYAQSYGVSDIL
jgi:hypothetical protein